MKTIIHFSMLSLGMLLIASSLLPAQQLKQGLLLTTQTLDTQANARTSRIYLSGHKVLLEVEGEPIASLYDAEKDELYLIDRKNKEYLLLNSAELESMGSQLGQAQAALQEQLKALPESQRNMLEAQLQQPANQRQKLSYTRQASGVPVKAWKTTQWTAKEGKQTYHEVYLVSYADLGEDQDDLEPLMRFNAYLQRYLLPLGRFLPAMPASQGEEHPQLKKGFPVKSVYYNQQGKPEFTCSLQALEEVELAKSTWEIPKGFKQIKLLAAAE